MRPNPRVLTVLALGVVAALTALVVVLVAGLGGGSGSGSEGVTGEPQRMQATATLTPQAALFGDTVTARVDVTFDRKQFDPGRVHVVGSFHPWTAVGPPAVEREDAGSTTYLRTTFTLRCVDIPCVPGNKSVHYQFRPARVLYAASASQPRRVAAAIWPVLVVHSRLEASEASPRDPLAAPWRADVISLPAVTYRISPAGLTAAMLGSGALLLALAGLLAYRAVPRRAPELPPPPPPAPVLVPLEKALRLLEESAGLDAVDERRRSLELVADELALLGDRELEGRARRLAWSEEGPEPDETQAVAASVRDYLQEKMDAGIA